MARPRLDPALLTGKAPVSTTDGWKPRALRAEAQRDALAAELAKERERFTMHTAEVGAWTSALAQQFGLPGGKASEVCNAIMTEAESLSAQLAEAKGGLEKIKAGALFQPVGAGDGDTYVMTGHESRRMQEIAAITLLSLNGKGGENV